MKSFIKGTLYALLLLSGLSAFSQTDEERYKIIEPVKESIINLYGKLDWFNFEGRDQKDETCKAEAFEKFKNLKNPFAEMTNKEFVVGLLPLSYTITTIEKAVEGTNFDQVKEPKGSFMDTPNFKRDKMLEKLQTARSPEQFVDFYGTKLDQTKVDFTEEEKKRLIQIYKDFEEDYYRSSLLKSIQLKVGDCNYSSVAFMKATSIQARQVKWKITYSFRIYCKCDEDSTPLNLKKWEGFLTSEAISTIQDYDVTTIRFTSARKPKITLESLYCCGTRDPMYEDGDGYDETTPKGEGGQKSDEGEKPEPQDNSTPKDKDKDCCFEEQANNTIGFFPVIGLNDNFDSTAIGIGVEFLHGFGNSFGNNQWYAGLQGEYITDSRQDGEVKTNAFAVAGIAENRTPILPCAQWTQRVCLQYSTGSLEAFGNQDDFSGLTFGIHTGFNLDVSPTVSVTADATVLTLGSTTLESNTGEEFKQDIGDLNLGSQRVRFGVRFRF